MIDDTSQNSRFNSMLISLDMFKKLRLKEISGPITFTKQEFEKATEKFKTIEIPEKYEWEQVLTKIKPDHMEKSIVSFQAPSGIGLGDYILCPYPLPPWIDPLPPKSVPCGKIQLGKFTITLCPDPDEDPDESEPIPELCDLHLNKDGDFECKGKCPESEACIGYRIVHVKTGISILTCGCGLVRWTQNFS